MKLLIISNNPNRPSFRQRIGIYIETLRAAGVECKVARLPNRQIKRVKLFRQAGEFDAVLLHKKCLNFWDAFWLRKYSRKIIYDFDDAIMYSSLRPNRDKSSHFRLFRRTVKLADMIIAGNRYLARLAQEFNDNVHVLATGLDTKVFDLAANRKEDGQVKLAWIGSKSTLRYLEQIKPALEEVGRKFDNVILRIVCDEFFKLENMKVEKRRWSLTSHGQDLVSSDIGLAPLPDNRFTRGKCGFKILQYQAAGLAVVTSPVGVNSDFVKDGTSGYLATNTQQWAQKISELVNKPQLREQMGQNGRDHVQSFDRSEVGPKLCELIGRSVNTNIPVTQGPLVSICIPTFNRKEYLSDTMESILNQTYKNIEIVIVDDGSTDGTDEMVKKFGFPISYHWQENAGDAAARNKLISLAKGEYISFIDSDDLLIPDAVERMVRAARVEPIDTVVYGSYYRIDEQGKIYGKCNRRLYSGKITSQLFESILVHSCGSLFPKRILKGRITFDTTLKVCSDYAVWLELSMKYPFKALAEPTFKRRRHESNLSSGSFENCLTEFNVLKNFYYNQGGDKVIPVEIAKKVFAKEASRAGRAAIRQGLYNEGYQLLIKSLKYRPNFKTLIYLLIASAAKSFFQLTTPISDN